MPRPIPSFFTLLAALPLCAQPQPPNKPLTFEVASVRLADMNTVRAIQISPQRSGGRISWTTFLNVVLAYAERLQTWQISGPIPQDVFAFQVETMPDATDEQVRQMFRALFADRFRMTAHRVTKDLDGFALTLAKTGLKIKEAKEGDPPPPMPEWFAKIQPTAFEGKVQATMEGRGVGALNWPPRNHGGFGPHHRPGAAGLHCRRDRPYRQILLRLEIRARKRSSRFRSAPARHSSPRSRPTAGEAQGPRGTARGRSHGKGTVGKLKWTDRFTASALAFQPRWASLRRPP
jgi:hypothetical protein